MSKTREELEKILREYRTTDKDSLGKWKILVVREIKANKMYEGLGETPIQELAQAILEAGYRRVEDMEIDKERLKLVPAISRILLDFEKTHGIGKAREMFDILVQQIAEAKGIIKVKKGK